MSQPSLTFTAALTVVPGCERCTAEALRLTAQALAQSNLTSLTIRPGKEHAHPDTVPPPVQENTLFPVSDTNGSDAEAVARHLATLL